jgi:hypothetical protein
VVLRQDASLGSISTIVLRGSTEGFLEDVERAVNDGVNAYKVRRFRQLQLLYSPPQLQLLSPVAAPPF